MTSKIDPDLLEQAIAAYVDGATLEAAGSIAGVSEKTMRNRLRKAGLQRPATNLKIDPALTVDWIALYEGGLTCPEIGARYGVSTHTVRAHLKRHGIARRKPGTITFGPEIVQEWATLYEAGLSCKMIGAQYDVLDTTVYGSLKRLGMKMRPVNERAPVNQVPAAMKEAWAAAYLSGQSTIEIAAASGWVEGTVNKYLREEGVHLRTSAEARADGKLVRPIPDDVFTMDWALSERGAWFVGMVVTDGHIRDDIPGEPNASPEMKILLKNEDLAGVEWLCRAIGWDIDTIRWEKRHNAPYLRLRHPRIRFLVDELGIQSGRKSGIVVSPPQLIDNRHYWRGVIDGDGFVRIDKKKSYPYIGLKNNSYGLLEEFHAYCGRVGVKSGIYNGDTVRVWGPGARVLARLLWGDCTFTIPRKWEIAQRVAAQG